MTVTSLCPCSKEISDYGAHNQRGAVTVEVRTRKDEDGTPVTLPMGDLIFAAEESASCRGRLPAKSRQVTQASDAPSACSNSVQILNITPYPQTSESATTRRQMCKKTQNQR